MGGQFSSFRFALLLSPDKLDESTSPGEDEIATREDFRKVWKWLPNSGSIGDHHNYAITQINRDEHLQRAVYGPLVRVALKDVFEPIRNTFHSDANEIVLLYYAGHGLDEGTASTLNERNPPVSPTPNLVDSLPGDYFQAANPFITQNRQLQGGEFCLHHVGFCDLEGLLRPWIAALRENSINIRQPDVVKRNKHLVVIADSCYSGKLAENLEILATKPGPKPWNENGCSVTVQAACSADEPTFGGCFTPCFVFFNKPENQERLEQLKQAWGEKCAAEKEYFKAIELPSPMVVSTRVQNVQDPTMAFSISTQFSYLTLFHDPAFFKFCYLSRYTDNLSDLHFQGVQLNFSTAETFLAQPNFTIYNYKLKTSTAGPYVGTPMGQFLVKNQNDSEHPVCVEIHFAMNDKSKVTAIDLVDQVHTPFKMILYPEEFPAPRITIAKPTPAWDWNTGQPSLTPGIFQADAKRLVAQCCKHVGADKWRGAWDMKRSFKESRNHSSWMNEYIRKYYPNTD